MAYVSDKQKNLNEVHLTSKFVARRAFLDGETCCTAGTTGCDSQTHETHLVHFVHTAATAGNSTTEGPQKPVLNIEAIANQASEEDAIFIAQDKWNTSTNFP